MANIKPVKAIYTGSDITALGEMQTGDDISASLISLDATNFETNLDNTITDVQKLADAVDELVTGGSSAKKYGVYTLAANQTTNLAAGNRVNFTQSSGTLGDISSGVLTLAPGLYKFTSIVHFTCSGSTGGGAFQVYDVTTTPTAMGVANNPLIVTQTTNGTSQPLILFIQNIASPTNIELRIISSTLMTTIWGITSFLLVEEL